MIGGWVLAAGLAAAQEPLIHVRAGVELPYKSKTVAMGQEFVAKKPLYVTALGYIDEGGDGLAKDRLVRLYRVDDEALLATATVARASGEVRGGFRFAALPQAVRLAPGRYVAAADFEEGSDRYLSMVDVADFNAAGGAVENPKTGRWSLETGGFPGNSLKNLNGMAVHMCGANLLFALEAPAAWTEAKPLTGTVELTDEQDAERLAPFEGIADRDALSVARALLEALRELPSRKEGKLLSGQFMGWYPVVSLATANEIYQQTSNWVAVAGFDYYETFVNTPKTKPDLFKPPRWQLVNELAKEHWRMGGLVTISCHMTNPWDGGLAWSKTGRFEDLLDRRTPAHARYMEQVDEVARGLADLQEAGVPVLFRPFHEMTGAFWWGAKNPVAFRKVWRGLFDYYTNEKGLHNLIWVWSPLVSSKAMDYYPGNAYVDMTGLDIYAASVAVAKGVYGELMKTGKPFAVTEFGPPGHSLDNTSPRNFDYGPFARQVAEHLPDAVFFLAWRDAWGLHRNLNVQALLDDPLVLNRGELRFIDRLQGFEHFVTRDGNRLKEGDAEFRFMGANMPGVVLPYDFTLNLPERKRLPDAWEQENAMKTLTRMGLRVVRTWNLPIRKPDEAPQPWHYVLAPGRFNEEAFKTIDRLLMLANRHRVRVLLDLTAGYGDYLGGVGTYAAHRGKPRKAFFTDPQLREDYKATVRFVLNRVNTLTGLPYKEDKAVFAWQFGNEIMEADDAWLAEMAAYMKELDPNHLVAETRHRPGAPMLVDPNIDLVTRHFYTSYAGLARGWEGSLADDMEKIGWQRPVFVGEYGPYVDGKNLTKGNVVEKHNAFLQYCIDTPGVCGAMLWSMYFHNSGGGYTWHQIYTFPSVWSYHFPGSASGDAHQEIGIVQGLRDAAFRIRGLSVPVVDPPEAPELLPFGRVPMFAWRGSAGAEGYDVERAASAEGPWAAIAENVSDADVAYRPLFSDETAKPGGTYFYRVVARNTGGRSPPSNALGPVKAEAVCFVDEFKDLSRMSARSDGLTLDNTYNARYAEYLFRVCGTTDDWISYAVAGPAREARVTAFFAAALGAPAAPVFLASADGQTFAEAKRVTCVERAHIAPPHAGDKARQTQADYTVALPKGTRHLKIVWTRQMALDRVEIEWGRISD
jgi:beta-mannanase